MHQIRSVAQSCPTLCDPIDSSPPGSTVPGILQARTLEWVAISKIDLKIKHTRRDKEGHYIMMNGSIQEEDIAIVIIYSQQL